MSINEAVDFNEVLKVVSWLWKLFVLGQIVTLLIAVFMVIIVITLIIFIFTKMARIRYGQSK